MNEETKNKIAELLFQDSMEKLGTDVEKQLDDMRTVLEAKIEGIKTAAYADIKQLESLLDTEKPIVINIGTIEKPKKKAVHKAFKDITKILSSAKRKEKNIMMVGGAGGGKTHLASSIAEALKLPFYPMSVGLQTTKSDLLGFINANGIYMPSPVRLAYENGGVLLLDEFDAAHAGVVTILNSLLANGHCSFPDGTIMKHKDFICLCACNTYGKGGTIDYVGRNRLDAATLDRFIIVDVGYDTNLEKKLTNNNVWFDLIKKIREQINKQGIKMIVSPRASMDGADLLDAGFTYKEVIDMCIFKGCDNDIKTKIMKNIEIPSQTTLKKEHSEQTKLFGSEAESELEERMKKLERDLEIIADFDRNEITVFTKGEASSYNRDGMDVCFIGNDGNAYQIAIGEYRKYQAYIREKTLWVNANVKDSSGKITVLKQDINESGNSLECLETWIEVLKDIENISITRGAFLPKLTFIIEGNRYIYDLKGKEYWSGKC